MLYIFLFVMLFILSFIKGKDKSYKIGLFSILLTTCLRAQNIGIDTMGGYHDHFNWINSGANLVWLEPGWILVNKIAIWLGLGYQGVLIISGFLTLLPVSYVIKKTCIDRRYSLAVYYGMCFVLISYNLMRQMIAVSFALLSMYFYINGKLRYAVFWFISGSLFHSSIFFILPLVFLLNAVDIKYSTVILLVFASFLLGLLLSDDFFVIASGKYAKYLLRGGKSGFRASFLKPAIFSLLFDVFFLCFIKIKYCILRENPYFFISFLSVIVINLTMRMAEGTRIVLYFSQAQMICFPNYIKRIEIDRNRTVLNLLYITYLFTNFMRILIDLWETLNPYSFFWGK